MKRLYYRKTSLDAQLAIQMVFILLSSESAMNRIITLVVNAVCFFDLFSHSKMTDLGFVLETERMLHGSGLKRLN